MENNIDIAEKLLKFAKEYLSSLKKQEKLSKQGHELYGTATRTRMARIRDDIQTNGEHIMRIEHELHCLAVELGIAKKEEWRYGNKNIGAATGEMHGSIRELRREPSNK